VLGFFSRHRNRDSLTPSTAGECVPPPLVQGGYTLTCWRGGGGSHFRRGTQTLWHSRYICTLCLGVFFATAMRIALHCQCRFTPREKHAQIMPKNDLKNRCIESGNPNTWWQYHQPCFCFQCSVFQFCIISPAFVFSVVYFSFVTCNLHNKK
jgi:hypothetical protein